jgi:hypothetical protein
MRREGVEAGAEGGTRGDPAGEETRLPVGLAAEDRPGAQRIVERVGIALGGEGKCQGLGERAGNERVGEVGVALARDPGGIGEGKPPDEAERRIRGRRRDRGDGGSHGVEFAGARLEARGRCLRRRPGQRCEQAVAVLPFGPARPAGEGEDDEREGERDPAAAGAARAAFLGRAGGLDGFEAMGEEAGKLAAGGAGAGSGFGLAGEGFGQDRRAERQRGFEDARPCTRRQRGVAEAAGAQHGDDRVARLDHVAGGDSGLPALALEILHGAAGLGGEARRLGFGHAGRGAGEIEERPGEAGEHARSRRRGRRARRGADDRLGTRRRPFGHRRATSGLRRSTGAGAPRRVRNASNPRARSPRPRTSPRR